MRMEYQVELSAYEKQRLKNIEENKRMLESLGLLRSFKPILDPPKRRPTPKPRKVIKRTPTTEPQGSSLEQTPDRSVLVRRSLRVKGLTPDLDGSVRLQADDEDADYKPTRTPKIKRDNTFGAIPDIAVGTHWLSRMECSSDGVHRPTVAGIHGGEAGCYSIALSGGYEDDLDLGDSFTFTGEGGRDLKGTKNNPKNLRTAPQSKDQTLTRGNLALSISVETREPVRVIRGYKCPSGFAPEYGYRYDGLYTVEKYWSCIGLSGYLVYKFILKRMDGQAPPPWKEAGKVEKPPLDSDEEELQFNPCKRLKLEDETSSVDEAYDSKPPTPTLSDTSEVASHDGIISSQCSTASTDSGVGSQESLEDDKVAEVKREKAQVAVKDEVIEKREGNELDD